MSVPEEIRAVTRPRNTVVVDTGRPGPKRYVVRERNGFSKPSKRGNPQPRNGKVIGHITNGEFVPSSRRARSFEPVYLEYGAARFVKTFAADVYEDLKGIYDISDVYTIMSVAICFIIGNTTSYSDVKEIYEKTFVSVYYENASVSRNTLLDLVKHLGMNEEARTEFFNKRIERTVASNHHIAIDSTLVQDTSTVNDLSHFSWKARVKGCKDVSVLYAFDVEAKETLCASVYPGNCVDASAYSNFIRNNNITRGIIVADKGFPISKIDRDLLERPDLHYIAPLKRNSSLASKYEMHKYEGVLRGIGKRVEYKKHIINRNKILYSFRDVDRAFKEDKFYIDKALATVDFYNAGERQAKMNRLGTIVFMSDIDVDPAIIYQAYTERWNLELVFKHYKSDLDMDNTRVHSDFSVIGDKFIRTICTIITNKILDFMRGTEILNCMTYGKFMRYLKDVWRKKNAPEPALQEDDGWHNRDYVKFEILEAIGLVEPSRQPSPRRRGRPRKVETQPTTPKRPRGRPRKIQAK